VRSLIASPQKTMRSAGATGPYPRLQQQAADDFYALATLHIDPPAPLRTLYESFAIDPEPNSCPESHRAVWVSRSAAAE
jgi:hypothetical protein